MGQIKICFSFLKNLLSGRESFMPVQNTPKIKTVSAWDGKDHKIEQTLDDDL